MEKNETPKNLALLTADEVTLSILEVDAEGVRIKLWPDVSSNFDRQQMHEFIERIFDRLSESGVDDAETTEQYRDWRRADGLH